MEGCTWDTLKELADNINVDEELLRASNLVLFGAGMNGTFALEKLKKEYSVYAFSDNHPQYRCSTGKVYEGLEVIVPEKLKEVERVFVIITVTGHHYRAVKEQLLAMDIPHITYMEYVLKRNFHKFQRVYELLEDEFSKKTYLYLLMSHITCDMSYLKEVFVRNQYFEVPEFNMVSAKEIFVDCGAYVGDSMERFVVNRSGVFQKIYCFEPTERTYKAMGIRRERLLKEWGISEEQIVTEQKLVSWKNERENFASNMNEETANRIVKNQGAAETQTQVEAVSLDAYFADKEKPSFIKADVEGAEMDVIKGAERIISTCKPLLAICIYHGVDDLYEIPLKLADLNPEYKMSVRHHMPNYHETVLYCR